MKTIINISVFVLTIFASQNIFAVTNYVSKTGGHVSPFTSWANAATNIQAAVNVASDGDTVLVNDGTYYPANQISVTEALTVKSVNGAEKTIVNGSHLDGCFYLSDDSIIDGFTITNGYYENGSGGGLYGGTVNNCTISGNSSMYGGGTAHCTVNNSTITGNSAISDKYLTLGGGTYDCTVNSCIISGNSAGDRGGGTYGGTVNNSTISGNSAGTGGGASHSTVFNCTISGNSAGGGGGGTSGGTVNTCTISGNSAYTGGGTSGGTINNCTILGNLVIHDGGGTAGGTVSNCTISLNSAYKGGGTYSGTVNNCTISENSARWGGGTYHGTVNNCTISENSASYGGGASRNTVNNCTISKNSARYDGGGMRIGTVNNSTFSGNRAKVGGGASRITFNNCIIWDNSAKISNNFHNSTIKYSCSYPLPFGTGNISNNPQFASSSDFHLQDTSPCINAGANAYAAMPFDLDGYPRIVNGIVDMGAYESVNNSSNLYINATDGTTIEKVNISWNTVINATKYKVYRNTEDNIYNATDISSDLQTTSFDDTTVIPNKKYYYWVKAENDSGSELLSNSDIGYAKLKLPTDIDATDGKYNNKIIITLSNVNEVTEYSIYRNRINSFESARFVGKALTNLYVDTFVSPGKTYYYWVVTDSALSESDSGYAILINDPENVKGKWKYKSKNGKAKLKIVGMGMDIPLETYLEASCLVGLKDASNGETVDGPRELLPKTKKNGDIKFWFYKEKKDAVIKYKPNDKKPKKNKLNYKVWKDLPQEIIFFVQPAVEEAGVSNIPASLPAPIYELYLSPGVEMENGWQEFKTE